MKTLQRLSLLAALSLLNGSCAEQEATALWATAVLNPGGSCLVTPALGSGAQVLQRGFLDVAVSRHGYIASINVVSGMPGSSTVTGLGPEAGHNEANRMNLRGATVRYDVQGLANELPQGFFQYTPVGIDPGQAGLGIVNLVPPQVLDLLRNDPHLAGEKDFKDSVLRSCYENVFGPGNTPKWKNAPLGGRSIELIARVQFEAQLLDGTTVLSNELIYPIEVCAGCLVAPQRNACGLIAAANSTSSATTAAPCFAGQDTSIDSLSCFNSAYFIDESAMDWIAECAYDPNWPAIAEFDEGLQCINCGILGCPLVDSTGTPTPGFDRESYLLFMYAYERVETFCSFLTADAPLYPPQ
ncbi:MAG: hypothetical protein ACI9WU_001968 [Myxococcota bacterium]|jgi:hypothetical protein